MQKSSQLVDAKETLVTNPTLPIPCLCPKSINTAVTQGSGPWLYPTVLDVARALAQASNKFPFCVCIAVDVLFSQFWGFGPWHNTSMYGDMEMSQ